MILLVQPCEKCRGLKRIAHWCAPCQLRRAQAAEASSRANRAKAKLKANYGVTPEQYSFMYWQQDGKCKICRTEHPGGRGTWHVDHNHATGKVRGLLCNACNVGLGHFKDSPELLGAAAAYLESEA